MRLRTYTVSISALVVALIFLVISSQTRKILDRGFQELGAAEVKRATDILQAVIKSKRENLTSFKQLIAADQDITTAIRQKRLKERLQEIKVSGRFDFVDFIFPDGTSAHGNEKQFGNGSMVDKTLDAENFSAIDMGGKIMLVSFCLKNKATTGVLVLGYQLTGPFEERLSQLTGSRVKFLLREAGAPSIASKPTSPRETVYVELSHFPLRTLVAELDLDWSIFNGIDSRLSKSLIFSGTISLLLFLGLLYLLLELGFVRRFGGILYGIKAATFKLEDGAVPEIEYKRHPLSELDWLSRAFSQFANSIRNYEQKNREQALVAASIEKKAALAGLAQQVAHDIRSPLAALEMFVDTYDQLPEEPRNMMKGCVSRTLDVANTLLDKFKAETSQLELDESTSLDVPREVYLISTLIDAIVSEKRVQYAKREGLEIRTGFTSESYGLFVFLNALRFKRILSNIIDNAAEAIEEKGRITVRLSAVGTDRVSICVEDNGKGIPAEVLPKLGMRGSTYGKSSGSGLGLHYAKSVIEAVGGTYDITSTVGVGTKFEAILKRAKTPAWFAPELVVSLSDKIIVVDDDPSIHHLWDERFRSLGLSSPLVHLYSPEQLCKWVRTNGSQGNVLFLCDYEFAKEQQNGLDLISSLDLSKLSLLVTTHVDDIEVRARAEALEVKIVPKRLARYAPIRISGKS